MEDKFPSYKVRIYDIVNGRFISSESNQYVITPLGEKIRNVNMLGNVTEKFDSKNSKYSSLTIDDGTGTIKVKVFGKSTRLLEGFKLGDIVIVIGTVSEYQDEIYIYAESVNALKPDERNYENLRRLEILERLSARKDIVDNLRLMKGKVDEEKLIEYAKKEGLDEESLGFILEKEVDYKPQILDILENLDDGKGVDMIKLFERSELSDELVEKTVDDLLSEGYIFEPVPGKFKVIKA